MIKKELINNREKNRYEYHVDGRLSRIEYILANNEIYLTHTEVDSGLEGQGIGKEIIAFALKDIEDQKLKLIPLCPFVASFIRLNPEWKTLLKNGINI